MDLPPKYPVDELDYQFDFADWLAAGETIVDQRVTDLVGGIVADPDRVDLNGESEVTFWLSGGIAGRWASALVSIETSAGRTLSERATLWIRTPT